MRQVIGGLVMALGMAAAPAFAADGATPADGAAAAGGAPVLAAGATALPVLATAPAVAVAAIAPAGFRLAPLTLAIAEAKPLVRTTALVAGLSHRFTGTMMEYYPFAGSGFHLSGGTRLFQRRDFLGETARSANGALAVTRTTMSTGAVRPGFRRFDPVATVGYTKPLNAMMQIGVEAGAMAGRAFAATPGLGRHSVGYRSDGGFHPDAIANLVFGMHF